MKEEILSEEEELILKMADSEIEHSEELNELQKMEVESFKELSNKIKSDTAKGIDVESPDFYNYSLLKKIITEDNKGNVPEKKSSMFSSPLLWMTSTMACLLLGFFFPKLVSNIDNSNALTVYSPDESIRSVAKYNSEINAVIIDLIGMKEIPESKEIRGKNIASYQLDGIKNNVVKLANKGGNQVFSMVLEAGYSPEFFTN